MFAPLLFVCILVTFDFANLKIVTSSAYIQGQTIDDPYQLINITTTVDKKLKDDVVYNSLKTMKISYFLLNEPVLRKDSISDLPNLENLEVSFIKQIEPGAFRNVPKLTEINVTLSHFLTEIPEGVFNGLDVVKLRLKHSGIRTIAPRAFDNMPKLEEVDLSRNELNHWNTDWFFNVPNLKYIDFSLNNIGFVPDGAFKNIKNAEAVIRLRVCNIKGVGSRIFGGTKRVKSLDLTGNYIEHFGEDVLDGVKEMKQLDLTFNNIRCFSGDYSKIFVAKYTNLSYNLLSCACIKKVNEWKARLNSSSIILFADRPQQRAGICA